MLIVLRRVISPCCFITTPEPMLRVRDLTSTCFPRFLLGRGIID